MQAQSNNILTSMTDDERFPPLLAALANAVDIDRLLTEMEKLDDTRHTLGIELDAEESRGVDLTPETLTRYQQINQSLKVLTQLREAVETAQRPQWEAAEKAAKEMPSQGLTKSTFDRLAQAQGLYVCQDARQFVGTALLFHAQDGKGYTTDLARAHLFTEDEVIQLSQSRPTDIPRRLADMLAVSSLSVDDQDLQVHLRNEWVRQVAEADPEPDVAAPF